MMVLPVATRTVRVAWIVLLVASAPVLLDYAEHVLTHSWAWYALAFPACTIISVWQAEKRPSRTVPGILLMSFGIVWVVFGSASGILRLGRPGLVLAASGILAADGRLNFRRLVMMALAIPIPYGLLARIAKPLFFLNAEMLTRTLQASGVPALATLQGVERPGGVVIFGATDVGWTSAIFAFGLAWVLLERRGSSWGKTLIGSGLGALAGFAVHLLCTTALFALAEPSAIDDMRIWRDALSYCVIAAGMAAFWAVRIRARSGD